MNKVKINFENCNVTIGKMMDIHDNQNVCIYTSAEGSTTPTAQDAPWNLPPILCTKRALAYFQKALDKGLMTVCDNSLRWVQIGNKGAASQLTYFCGKVYGYRHSATGNEGNTLPEQALEQYFALRKIGVLLAQVHNASKKQAWRTVIDDFFNS